MLIAQCWQLRPQLASYVDNEIAPTERLIVEDHLRRCQACRERVERQRAVHDLLRRRSGEIRRRGPAWPSQASARGRSARGLAGVSLVAGASLIIALVAWGPWRTVPLAARGHIRDSTCGGGHVHTAPELQQMAGRDCVRLCVELGARYIFVSNGATFPIRNQGFTDLARFAEQVVEVEGQLRGNRLTVAQIRPLTAVTRHQHRPPAIHTGAHR
jgi:hypothetical protein